MKWSRNFEKKSLIFLDVQDVAIKWCHSKLWPFRISEYTIRAKFKRTKMSIRPTLFVMDVLNFTVL